MPPYGAATLADVLPGAATALGVPVERGDLPADPLDLTAALARRPPGRWSCSSTGSAPTSLRAHADLAPDPRRPRPARSATCPRPAPAPPRSASPRSAPACRRAATASSASSPTSRARTAPSTTSSGPTTPTPTSGSPGAPSSSRPQAAGLAATAVGPYAYAGSGLTRAVYRGATYTGAVSHGDLCALALRRAGRDPAGPRLRLHPRARPHRPRPRRRLGQLARPARSSSTAIVEQLVDGLPDDAALLVTADHGMLDVPAGDPARPRRASPTLADGVRVLAGEPRARYVHAEPGAEDDVLDALARRCSATGPGWSSRDEAVASGIFGPVDDALAARIGDVVALARGSWAFVAPEREPGPEPAGRLPRLAHRDRAGDPAAGRPRPRARLARQPSVTCQVRECAGWVARQVRCVRHRRRAALHRRRPPAPSGPAIVTTQRSTSAPGGVSGRTAVTGRSSSPSSPSTARAWCWAACPGGGTPARPRSHGSATCPRSWAPHQLRAVAGHLAVVEAVRQDDDVGREPVAAEVAALPDVRRARRRQRAGQRPAAQRAAGVVPAVGADQVDRPVGALAHRPVPRRGRAGRRRSARTDHHSPSWPGRLSA